jgi:hypothetical protein
MSSSHIQSRLQIRDLPYTPQQLSDIASQYNEDTAVILGKRESEEGRIFGMVLIILIVRNRRPVTIMTRRQSQNFDKRNFSVNRIVYL